MADDENTTNTNSNNDDDGVTFGIDAIITLVVVAVVISIVCGVLILCKCFCKKKRKNDKPKDVEKASDKALKKDKMDNGKVKEKEQIKRKKGEINMKARKSQANEYTGRVDKDSQKYLKTTVPVGTSAPKPKYVNSEVTSPKRSKKLNLKAAMQDAVVNIIDKYTIEEKRLELVEEIGKGAFGLVYKGTLKEQNRKELRPVAVKTVHGNDITNENVSAFIQEMLRMTRFGHKNVLTIIGMVFKKDIPYVVLPYMENHDLKSYLNDKEVNLNVRELLDMGLQVCAGMLYLSDHGYVHRDLAARNCMVSKDQVIKVADFGLSRDLHFEDYYQIDTANVPLPIRWMAEESINDGKYSTMSDVWSFGILMWEILTRGEQPYSGLTNKDVMQFVSSGKRLASPQFCPPKIYKLMQSCWQKKPRDRPSFQSVHSSLQDFLVKKSPKDKADNKYYNTRSEKKL